MVVCILGDGVQDAADSLMQCPDRASHRAGRLGEGHSRPPGSSPRWEAPRLAFF